MKWNALTSEKQVDDLVKNSSGKAILLFKHSTRCGISAHVLHNLESDWKQDEANNVTPYMLDLLNYRNVSAHIAQSLGVIHQSPQAILIKDGKVVYSASHHAIKFDKIKKFN